VRNENESGGRGGGAVEDLLHVARDVDELRTPLRPDRQLEHRPVS
jgi:hypothetical protein